jgi:hypothetical protein
MQMSDRKVELVYLNTMTNWKFYHFFYKESHEHYLDCNRYLEA